MEAQLTASRHSKWLRRKHASCQLLVFIHKQVLNWIDKHINRFYLNFLRYLYFCACLKTFIAWFPRICMEYYIMGISIIKLESGAHDRSWTCTPLLGLEPESSASANSATWAQKSESEGPTLYGGLMRRQVYMRFGGRVSARPNEKGRQNKKEGPLTTRGPLE